MLPVILLAIATVAAIAFAVRELVGTQVDDLDDSDVMER